MAGHPAPPRPLPLPSGPLPRPVREFFATEAAGGIVLLVAAVVALVWVNSPFGDSYETLWHTELAIEVGRFSIAEDLRHWVNDALMAVFFFVVGLEIKRELVAGELRTWRQASTPAIAALGGMVVPALLFVAINLGGAGARGWGIPMATDIAFALGVAAVLGDRVPAGLKLFLLTLAIVDDIGAIVVSPSSTPRTWRRGGSSPPPGCSSSWSCYDASRCTGCRSTSPSAWSCGSRCSSRASTPPSPAWCSD
jgi:hypothetical protein